MTIQSSKFALARRGYRSFTPMALPSRVLEAIGTFLFLHFEFERK